MLLEAKEGLGELVPRSDVEKYAKHTCTTCYGRGIKKLYAHIDAEKPTDHICHCASRRFIKKHQAEIAFDIAGQLRWKK